MFIVDMTVDTHAFVKTLTAAGMPEAQAEAVTTLVTAARVADGSRYLTKADLAEVATRSSVAALEADMAALKVAVAALPTKIDLERFATKADLAQCATKTDLERFATKVDLERFATKTEVAQCATKSELISVESSLKGAISDARNDIQRWSVNLVAGAVVLNAVTVVGAMLALAKMLGH